VASDHEYGALDRTWRFLAGKHGFRYINQPIALPTTSSDEIVDQIWRAVTPSTRVIFLSHITSPTALILPVEKICRKARRHNILTIIDGAHAPGQIGLNLNSLDADFYIGNLHKWLCAPKGSGFLYAHPRSQNLIEPLIVSWGWQSESPSDSKFVDYLEWQGTRDISAFLAVEDAIRFQKDHDWPLQQKRCFDILSQLKQQINNITKCDSICPDLPNWFSQMAACKLPHGTNITELKTSLYEQYSIEVPVLLWNTIPLIRISFQAYNSETDAQALAGALNLLLKKCV